MPASNGRIKCPRCGRYFSSASMYDHYPRAHQQKWSVHLIGTETREERREMVPVEVPSPPPTITANLFRRVDGFVILEDTDGHMWLAERIR